MERDLPQTLRGKRPVMTSRPGIACRPVSTPDDLDDPSIVKADGVVVLPSHVAWSGRVEYDLDDEQQRQRVYERVLTEGLDDDVRHFIRLEHLLEMWERIYLSPHVREAWDDWMTRRGLVH